MVETLDISELKKIQSAHLERMKSKFLSAGGLFPPSAIVYTLKEFIPKDRVKTNTNNTEEDFDSSAVAGTDTVGIFVALLPDPKQFYEAMISTIKDSEFQKTAEETLKVARSIAEEDTNPYAIASESLLGLVGGSLPELANSILDECVKDTKAFAFIRLEAVEFAHTEDPEANLEKLSRKEALCATLETTGYRRTLLLPFKEVEKPDGSSEFLFEDLVDLEDEPEEYSNFSTTGGYVN